MRLSFRDFHLQFDPTLRRERVPEAMFELLGPVPSVKPVFEGKPLPAAVQNGQQEMADAEQLADSTAAAQPNGVAAAAAHTAGGPDGQAAEAAVQSDDLEPVPEVAQQLFEQVLQPCLPIAECHAADC